MALGAVAGFRTPRVEDPVFTNAIPRQVAAAAPLAAAPLAAAAARRRPQMRLIEGPLKAP